MKRLRRFALWSLLVVAVGWLLLPGCELYPEGVTWSRVAWDREGKVLHLTLAADGRYRLKAVLAEIDAEVIAATLRHENRWFRWHPGVNPVSLLRGLAGNDVRMTSVCNKLTDMHHELNTAHGTQLPHSIRRRKTGKA